MRAVGSSAPDVAAILETVSQKLFLESDFNESLDNTDPQCLGEWCSIYKLETLEMDRIEDCGCCPLH